MKQVTKQEFLALFDPSVHEKLHLALKMYPDATALVCFENQMLDSSSLGERQALVVGPSNTFKSVEFCQGKWLNDLPSQRQYPTVWVSRDDFLTDTFTCGRCGYAFSVVPTSYEPSRACPKPGCGGIAGSKNILGG